MKFVEALLHEQNFSNNYNQLLYRSVAVHLLDSHSCISVAKDALNQFLV